MMRHNISAKTPKRLVLIFISVCIFLLAGCTQFVITQSLEKTIDKKAGCSIGAITDELPNGFHEGGKPTMEAIDELKDQLYYSLADAGMFSAVRRDLKGADYEVSGSILDYRKGSGCIRFFLPMGGEAKITLELRLVDLKTNEIIFSGNFKGMVSDWKVEGNDMFVQVASDFAYEMLEDLYEIKKNQKNSEEESD